MTILGTLRHRIATVSPGVDVGSVLGIVGGLLKWFAATFAAPAVVALGVGESPLAYVLAGLAAAVTGVALDRIVADGDRRPLGPREGFLVVALVWLLIPVFGAVPFLLSGEAQLARPVDAYFEAVSGFTATGASVLTDIDALGTSLLFWRQLSHWLGGMGIIVLAIAVLPRLRVGGRQLLQSELPGPMDTAPLRDTVLDTARRLWTIYVGLTAVGMVAVMAVGWSGLDPAMDLFQAFSHVSSAVALGGFSTQVDSVRGFAPVTQWALCALMVVAGINFLRLYRLLMLRDIRGAVRDDELRLYLTLLGVGTALVAVELFASDTVHGPAGVRHAAFQTVSVMTTTGFATLDWTTFGPLATLTLLVLMLVGASAGSASGSIKVVRHLTMFRLARRELEQAVHREVVVPVRLSGATIEERALRGTVMFVVLYLLVLTLGAMALELDATRVGSELSAFEALGTSAACLGNVGPAFGTAGPFGSYAGFSDASTVVLTGLMCLGRVEIVPLAVLITRTYWRA